MLKNYQLNINISKLRDCESGCVAGVTYQFEEDRKDGNTHLFRKIYNIDSKRTLEEMLKEDFMPSFKSALETDEIITSTYPDENERNKAIILINLNEIINDLTM